MKATNQLKKIMTMKASFRFRLGAVHAMRPISENRMESRKAAPSLADKLAALKPVWSGKAAYLVG